MKTYQYRLRLKLLNPLLGHDKIAKTAQDAEQVRERIEELRADATND